MAGFDQWMTDPRWIEMIRNCMGSINYDPASNLVAQEYVQADTFCVHPDDIDKWGYGDCPPDNMKFDGLKQEWHGNVFCNPPYSAGNIDKFSDKIIQEYTRWNQSEDIDARTDNYVYQMIILVNSANDTRWYQQLLKYSQATLFVKGRIKFWKIENGKAWEKWEGVKSKEKGLGKIGNSPRYINTLFYFGTVQGTLRFKEVFGDKGTIMVKG